MSDNSLTKFEQPLQVELGASLRLAGAAATVHALAIAACLVADLDRVWTLLLAGLVVLHYARFLQRQAGALLPRGVRALAWDRRRGWRVRCGEGGWQRASLRQPVFVTLALVIVRFHLPGGERCSALIAPDRLPADAFRRLRVRLLQAVIAERN